jgi:hypothetical protein
VVVKKGDSIGTFLKAARDQLQPQFRELRAVSLDNLLYIKEDIVLPHHLTFYDLIINKARCGLGGGGAGGAEEHVFVCGERCVGGGGGGAAARRRLHS